MIDPVTNVTSKVNFCFEYGEVEWLAAKSWQSVRDNAAKGTGDVACPN